MSDIFQEVQEEYRREQMAKLWAKYRVAIVGGASALILAVAGYQGYSYWQAGRTEAASREFEKAAELIASGQGKEKEAGDKFAKLAANGPSGYAMAARFQEAAVRSESGDVKAAVALYDTIAASGGDQVFRDYAHLRAAMLLIETESLANIAKRLEPLTKGTSAWRVSALEMLGYASWRAGKKDEALKLYADVEATPDAPPGSKRRSKEMTALINGGMTVGDLKTRPVTFPGIDPLLLQPTPEQPSSLLGPGPEELPPTP